MALSAAARCVPGSWVLSSFRSRGRQGRAGQRPASSSSVITTRRRCKLLVSGPSAEAALVGDGDGGGGGPSPVQLPGILHSCSMSGPASRSREMVREVERAEPQVKTLLAWPSSSRRPSSSSASPDLSLPCLAVARPSPCSCPSHLEPRPPPSFALLCRRPHFLDPGSLSLLIRCLPSSPFHLLLSTLNSQVHFSSLAIPHLRCSLQFTTELL